MLKINGNGTIDVGTPEKPDLRPVAFNFSCVAEFCQLQGDESIHTLLDYLQKARSGKASLIGTQRLLYCALKYGARKEGIVFEDTLDSVGDLIGQMSDDAMGDFYTILAQSMPQAKKKESLPPVTPPQ